MNEPILKMHWERFTAPVDLDIPTANRLLLPYTTDAIDQLTLLSEGCANTHYKVTFKNKRHPVVIRIYVREKIALTIEIAVYKLVDSILPLSHHLYADNSCSQFPYPYAIIEYIHGKSMREVILSKNETAIAQCAFEAGQYLNQLRKIQLEQGGFFKEDGKIRPFNPDEKYLPFVTMLLSDSVVKDSLGNSLHSAVQAFIKKNASLLPNENDANLTHADYDPANMLVKQVDGRWKIVAILDWEFAFAGTYLLDMGMMLRYSHKLPACYEKEFIAGIQEDGFTLPPHWRKQAKLMDLLCLLQLAHYNPISARPKTNRDVVSLIADTLNNWKLF